MASTAEKIERAIGWVLERIGGVMLFASVTIIFFTVILRYIFHVGYLWLEETSRYLSIFVALTLAGHGFFWNNDITLDLVTNMVKKNKLITWILCMINAVAALVVSIIISYQGWLVFAGAAGKTTVSYVFPLRVLYAIVPIGFTLLALFSVLKIIVMLGDKEMKYLKNNMVRGKSDNEETEKEAE